jgi:hypothetical protein
MDPAMQATIAQLRAEVQALQTAATAAAAAAAPAPVPVPVFTLAPALASTAAFVDLTSTSGSKHFKGATESLNTQAFGFDDPADLQVFLDLVLKKSQVWGWNPVFTIPVTGGKGHYYQLQPSQPVWPHSPCCRQSPCDDLLLHSHKVSSGLIHGLSVLAIVALSQFSQVDHCGV